MPEQILERLATLENEVKGWHKEIDLRVAHRDKQDQELRVHIDAVGDQVRAYHTDLLTTQAIQNNRLTAMEATQAFHRGGLAALAVFMPLSVAVLGLILRLGIGG
mgnify:CR=1 FL=1